MKIAFVTDNGKSISPCFGRALYYLVLTVEDGKVTNQDLRGKYTVTRHPMLVDPIADCDVLVCGGMEKSTYEVLSKHKIQPIVTDFELIGPALHAFLSGELAHQEALVQ